MLRVEIDNVTYNHMMPPGHSHYRHRVRRVQRVQRQPADVKVSKHMILFQPGGGADDGERNLSGG